MAALLFAGAPSAFAQAEATPEATSLRGQPLYPTPLKDPVRQVYQAKWEAAKRAFDRAPNNADSIIWLGRRTAYLGRFREAIAIYTKGIEKFPNDARLYRHRAHRYLTTRQIDPAIADLEKAAALIKGKPDQVEPDGLPNAMNIPTSTLHSNIRYHLGLAYYLKGDFERAATWFGDDVAQQVNDDMLVASTHWLYMALRRLGRLEDAARTVDRIRPAMNVIENQAYHRLLLPIKASCRSTRCGPATPRTGIRQASKT